MGLQGKNEYWSEHFTNEDFSGLDIISTEFDGCTFTKCLFNDARFTRCNFVDCGFVECNLSVVDIEYSKFSNVCFRDSKLIGINWTKVAWPRFIFSSPVKFYTSILNDSSFYGLSLQELVLEDCKAVNVDFREGDFSSGNFTYTDLSGSLFNRTNLSGADFSEAINYDIDVLQNKVKQARFSRYEALRLLESLEIELVD